MVHQPHPYAWEPVRHSVFRDTSLADVLHKDGITVQPFLSPEQLTALRDLYQQHHTLSDEKGGMFYSVYSQDLAYREQIHQEVQQILQPTLDKWFQGYKNVINSYVIKLPGKASEFAIHQDTTALDETRFSPLSVWIPLLDITEENGAMCVVPGTHKLFSPYRGISFPFPFAKAKETVRRYLEPVTLKAGEAVVFDPRILHNSLPNLSDSPRVALICGIFPEEAKFNICFKENPEAEIEIYEQEDDFLLKYPNFLHHCHDRPVSGEVIKKIGDKFPLMTEPQVESLLSGASIEPKNLLLARTDESCNMIAEPDNLDREPIIPFEEIEADAHGDASSGNGQHPESGNGQNVAVGNGATVSARKGGFFGRLFGRRK